MTGGAMAGDGTQAAVGGTWCAWVCCAAWGAGRVAPVCGMARASRRCGLMPSSWTLSASERLGLPPRLLLAVASLASGSAPPPSCGAACSRPPAQPPRRSRWRGGSATCRARGPRRWRRRRGGPAAWGCACRHRQVEGRSMEGMCPRRRSGSASLPMPRRTPPPQEVVAASGSDVAAVFAGSALATKRQRKLLLSAEVGPAPSARAKPLTEIRCGSVAAS